MNGRAHYAIACDVSKDNYCNFGNNSIAFGSFESKRMNIRCLVNTRKF